MSNRLFFDVGRFAVAQTVWPATLTMQSNIDLAHLGHGTGVSVIRNAHITGKLEYREGDGPNITIRPGPCQVQETEMDATISWTDADSHGSAAIPIADFRRYVASKAIQLGGVATG